jgi:aminoglycoside phosphotransferase (APT) family kinase protein
VEPRSPDGKENRARSRRQALNVSAPAPIDEVLARQLIAHQFAEWAHLPVRPVPTSGWDNRSFRLGEDKLIRMPSAAAYAAQVAREQRWLPWLGPQLNTPIPTPLARGKPALGYAWDWSIYSWIKGEPLASAQAVDLPAIAARLHALDGRDGPAAGRDNFYRGGALSVYDEQTRQALAMLAGRLDTAALERMWERGLASTWQRLPVWVHGDVSAGNLLVAGHSLVGVIDFGQVAVGDPACDLAVAWTLFDGQSRRGFRSALPLDEETWARGRAWALWKAAIVAAGISATNEIEQAQCWRTLAAVLGDD